MVKSKNSYPTFFLLLKPIKEMANKKQPLVFLSI